MTPSEKPTIYIVSDGSGATSEHLLMAILVQFEGQDYEILRKVGIRTVPQVRAIAKEAAAANAAIFYTLVSEKTRRAMQVACDKLSLVRVDIFGTPLRALNDLFHTKPRSKPGLLYEADRENYDRMIAIDYTLKHDDGLRPHELKEADVILVGVSRASKSSTCFFLAYEGIRAANVPLVPGVEPPVELQAVNSKKVIGLTIHALRLQAVREVRANNLSKGIMGDYTDRREIASEIREASQMMEEHGWRSLDVSYMAIEEVAKEVMKMVGLKR